MINQTFCINKPIVKKRTGKVYQGTWYREAQYVEVRLYIIYKIEV